MWPKGNTTGALTPNYLSRERSGRGLPHLHRAGKQDVPFVGVVPLVEEIAALNAAFKRELLAELVQQLPRQVRNGGDLADIQAQPRQLELRALTGRRQQDRARACRVHLARHAAKCVSAAWPHGYMATWLHGCMATWLHGYMATWPHGYMAAWLHGYM
eukprot:3390660-Pyramimonas_sp.AAC.3